MAVAVQTSVFEGPFDLLLHLILESEVDIFEVNLSAVVDAYLAELEKMEHLELEVATEFLLIASTLVELKARRLLPKEDEPDLDDELALWEERDILLSRLLECKTFKDVARSMEAQMERAFRSVPRTLGPGEEFLDLMPNLLEGVTADDIRSAFIRALTPKPVPTVSLDHVTSIHTSVSDALTEVADEVRRAGRITFRQLTSGLVDRMELVVRFLAMLELTKQGIIDIDQLGGNFGSIVLTWEAGGELNTELVASDAYEG